VPSAGASRLPNAGRPRVQTLAYGPAPSPPASPAPPPARPTASVPAIEAPPVAPLIPAPGASHADATALPADFAGKLSGLGLTGPQIEAVLSLSREVVEQVVWEVVPSLAETIIKEELKRLMQA
jgi:hypothetical protein